MTPASRAGLGRCAVVTGASGLLGSTLARHLLEDGWQVYLWSRNPSCRTNELLTLFAGRAHWQAVDITDPSIIRQALRSGPGDAGVDLLVNNAGLLHQGLFVTETDRATAEMIEINLLGLLYTTKACARVMLRGDGGSVVNISSINAIQGNRGVVSYSSAKAGIGGLTASLARELGPEQIRVNTLMPGYFPSELSANVTDSNLDRIRRRTPLGRLGTVQDILPAFDFLTNPANTFVTAQTIVVDGGLTC